MLRFLAKRCYNSVDVYFISLCVVLVERQLWVDVCVSVIVGTALSVVIERAARKGP